MDMKKPSSESIADIREKFQKEEVILTEKKLKELFLKSELFSQFKDNPTNLSVDIVEPGAMDLRLTNFSGLDTNRLNNRAFSDLKVEGLDLQGGYVTSGGPDGVTVRYLYSPAVENSNKPGI
jgi:hypothetical protein